MIIIPGYLNECDESKAVIIGVSLNVVFGSFFSCHNAVTRLGTFRTKKTFNRDKEK